MRNQLWFKLTGAFALIIFIGAVVTVWLTSRGAATQFEHIMVANQMVSPSALQAALADYYVRQNDWTDLETKFDRLVSDAADGVMTGMMGSMMGMPANRIQVLNLDGAVVADSRGPAGGTPLTAAPLEHRPVIVDGELVGELVVEGSLMGAAMGTAMTDSTPLVSSVTRTVFVAAVLAALAGLLLAAVFVRQITRPLVDLTHASRQIAQGDLSVRVAVKSSDEVGELTDTFNQMAASLELQNAASQPDGRHCP